MLKASLSGADFIYVRDSESQKRLEEIFGNKSQAVGDPALSISRFIPAKRNNNKRVLGINVVSYKKGHSRLGNKEIYKRYTSTLSELIRRVLVSKDRILSFDEIVLFSTGDREDLIACYSLYNTFALTSNNHLAEKISIVARHSRLQAFIKEISQCSVVISTRLHSAIIPMSYGIPAICISYDPKATGFFKFLGMNRFQSDIVDIDVNWLLECLKTIETQRLAIPVIRANHENRMQNMLQEIGLLK